MPTLSSLAAAEVVKTELSWCQFCHHWWHQNHYVLHHISIKTKKGLISYKLPASWGSILKFPMNKNINDGTHSQCSGTHMDHGPWVPRTLKEVNNFESLHQRMSSQQPVTTKLASWQLSSFGVVIFASTLHQARSWHHWCNSLLKSLLANSNFLTWLLISWQHSCQPIRSHVRKWPPTSSDFNTKTGH